MDQSPVQPTPEIGALVQQMNTTGFACIPDYVPAEELAVMRSFVESAIEKSSGEYCDFKGFTSLPGSGLDEFGESPRFVELMHRVFQQGTGKPPVEEGFYRVLRCLTGRSGLNHSLNFHYDSYVVTALVPIIIPTEGMRGDLVMYPNTRKIRDTYFFNVIDKLLLDNRLSQAILKKCLRSKRFAPTHIAMVPGNLYLFWGYRSIHTNEPCAPDRIRSTALFHYVNPHHMSKAGVRAKVSQFATGVSGN